MVSWEGYSNAKVRNHTMKTAMTMLNKVSLEYRCVAKLYRICAKCGNFVTCYSIISSLATGQDLQKHCQAAQSISMHV